MSVKKEALKATAVGTVAGGTVVGGVFATQVAASAAIPTLMSAGATVVSGVGSIMPFWIGPIQAFAVAGTFSVALIPAIVIAAFAGAGSLTYTLYKLKKKLELKNIAEK